MKYMQIFIFSVVIALLGSTTISALEELEGSIEESGSVEGFDESGLTLYDSSDLIQVDLDGFELSEGMMSQLTELVSGNFVVIDGDKLKLTKAQKPQAVDTAHSKLAVEHPNKN